MAEARLACRQFWVILLVGCFATLCSSRGVGQEVAFDSPPSDLKVVTQEQYLAENQQWQALVASCRDKADACDASKIDSDVTVTSGPRQFNVRWAWLRDELNDAKSKNTAERAELMAKAAKRLSTDAEEATGSAGAVDDGRERLARAKADAILSRGEFRTVQQESWLDRKWALLSLWFKALIDGFYSRLPHSSWIAPLIEWGLLFAAAVALIVWAWRVTQQQRVELSVPESERQTVWQKESDDWARRAEAQAAAEDWREAVHSLYWAAIVMLEGRRFWRPNRARTPREYLPLLEAGSARQRALGGLTRIFERIWYGLRPAGRGDFEQAQRLLDELKAA